MFKPKGEKPYWEIIFDFVKDKSTGTIFEYQELSNVLDGDIQENRAAVYRAKKELLKTQKRSLNVERGVGYKLVEGMDIMHKAEDKHETAGRIVKAASFETSHINTIKLTPEEREKLDNFMAYNANIRQAFVSNAKAIEAGVVATRQQLVAADVAQLFTEDQVRKLKEMLGE